MATGSRILAWKITWTGEPGGLLSVELQLVDKTEHALVYACNSQKLDPSQTN